MAVKIDQAIDLIDILRVWAQRKPNAGLIDPQGWSILAWACAPADWQTWLRSPLGPYRSPDSASLPFISGYLGLMPYDGAAQQLNEQLPSGPWAPRLVRVDQAILVHGTRREVWLTGGLQPQDVPWLVELARARGAGAGADDGRIAPLDLVEQAPAAAYLDCGEQVLRDIRQGRYYQLNLLRYFNLVNPPSDWSAYLVRRGGPFSSWFQFADLDLISFSPERFVQRDAQGLATFPIKGTAARSPDSTLDRQSAAELLTSAKDQAELAMIVDLMRHDLQALSPAGGVRVEQARRLQSFAAVHHLEAVVRAQLKSDQSWSDFWRALAPGGSITGAPKHEVVAAIHEYEQRSRGYFMGHAFYCDDRGHFDSSVLIRTVMHDRRPGGRCEFAAGSGLVSRSYLSSELKEIEAKAATIGRIIPTEDPFAFPHANDIVSTRDNIADLSSHEGSTAP